MKKVENQQNKFLYGLPIWDWFVYRLVWILFAIGRLTIFRVSSTGTENLPEDEPYLLLANHSNLLDSLWLAERLYRPVRPMGSAQMLKTPLLGSLLRTLGCFPKTKFTKDRKSMEKMQELYDQGFVVLIFPEGSRTILGRTQDILPGIGKLIKRMNPTVVYAVSNSAYLFQPRWAKYPRWVPIEMNFDGPYRYSEEMTIEELNKEVQSKLQYRPMLSSNSEGKVKGWRMAHGLPTALWACPKCFQNEGLVVDPNDGNAVICSQCGARWTIDVECRLTGETETTLIDAVDSVVARFGQPPVMERTVFESSGVALLAEESELRLWPKGGKAETLCRGKATLGHHGFSIEGEGNTFHASIEDMRAFSVEMGNKLFFRVEDKLFQFILTNESVYKWRHFLRGWKASLT